MGGAAITLGTAAGTVLFFLFFAFGHRALAWTVGGCALAAGLWTACSLWGAPLWAPLFPVSPAVALWGWIHLASRWADADEEASRHYPEFPAPGGGRIDAVP